MKRFFMMCLVFVIVTGLAFNFVSGKRISQTGNLDISGKTRNMKSGSSKGITPRIDYRTLPLYFIGNRGQVHEEARFYAKASRYTLWLTKAGLVFDSTGRENPKATGRGALSAASRHPSPGGNPQAGFDSPIREAQNTPHHSSLKAHNSTPRFSRDVSRLLFVGANLDPEMSAVKESKLKVNYFTGSDKSKWRCDVPTSKAVLYKSLYKDIDLKVYGIEGQVEYDWIVKAGADPSLIKFRYKNVKGTRVDEKGDLLVETAFGELVHKKPVSFQFVEEGGQGGPEPGREMVEVTFKKIGQNTYGFAVGEYDKSRDLIIDPLILTYATYFGGSDLVDTGFAIAADDSGCVYVTGETGSIDFPILNEYETWYQGGQSDVFIAKFDTTQSGAASLLYSTYLGGDGWDSGYGLAVDGSGIVYVTGRVSSANFPAVNQYQTYQAGVCDAFVAKLDPAVSGAAGLLYCTYLGSTGGDQGKDIAVDGSGYVYVTGHTTGSDFPVLNQYQTHSDSGWDVFVTKLDTTQSGTAALLYSTYLGGSGFDTPGGIAVDGSGHAYVTGRASGSDFPVLNEYQGPSVQYSSVFVTRLDTNQSGAASLIYSTCLASAYDDVGVDIAVDNSANAYVVGYTWSSGFPCLNQYQTHQGMKDMVIARIDTNQAGAASLIYSTYLGGSDDDDPAGIAVDGSGCVYVAGTSFSTDFPILEQYQGKQGTYSSDVVVSKLNTKQSGSAALLFSTYLGGTTCDNGLDIAIDSSRNVYVTGDTCSQNFPVLNAYQDSGHGDAILTKLSMNYITVTSPNGGESWQAGDAHAITWTAAGVGGLLKITLWKDDVLVGTIAKDIDPAAGSYNWTVGQYTGGAAAPGSGYAIKIREIGAAVVDSSDAPFNIASINVTSPNGGESWQAGAAHSITWTTAGVSGLLKITLWKDGASVGTIAKDIDPAAGSYAWTVGQYSGGGAAPGSGYSVKIREIGTAVADSSDAPFTILPSVTVTAPNGGENWQIGAGENITWNTVGVSGLLKITLWKDGAAVGTIAKDIDPAAGFYAWAVGQHSGGTASAGSGYTIKIRQIGTTVSDDSDAGFSLFN